MRKNKKNQKENKEQYSVGMIVCDEDCRLGVINEVDNEGQMEGNKASAIWVDGHHGDCWYEWGQLEILENPITKYCAKYNNKKIILTSDEGPTASFKYDKDHYVMENAFIDFLDRLKIFHFCYESQLESFVLHINDMILHNETKRDYEYYSCNDEADKGIFHNIRIELVDGE